MGLRLKWAASGIPGLFFLVRLDNRTKDSRIVSHRAHGGHREKRNHGGKKRNISLRDYEGHGEKYFERKKLCASVCSVREKI